MILRSDDVWVEVMPDYGGRIAQITFLTTEGPQDLLIPAHHPPPNERPLHSWGCYPMAPWPNRIAGGRFSFKDTTYEVPVNFGDAAIHGTVCSQQWKVVDAGSSHCVLATPLGSDWPWPGEADQRIEVGSGLLTTRLTVRTRAGAGFPAGAGWHPWFSRRKQDPSVTVRASGYFETGEALIPTGPPVEPSGDNDLREGKALGKRRIDAGYAGVTGPLEIRWDDITLNIDLSANLSYAFVFTPLGGFCVEPQSCAADAFNLEAAGISAGVSVVTADTPLVVEAKWRVSAR